MLRIAIVDDEITGIERITDCLKTYCEKNGLNCKIETFSRGDRLSFEYKPVYDIIFLDIEMEPINGIETARIIRKTDGNVVIIFVTKMAQCAVNGYEVDAMGFIVKPVDPKTVWLNLDKARRTISRSRGIDIVLTIDNGVKKLSSNSIYYVEISDHYLIYHTDEGDFSMRTRKTLGEAAKELGPSFKQYSRCYLLNLNYVSRVDGTAVTVGNSEIFISRAKRKDIIQDMANYLGSR